MALSASEALRFTKSHEWVLFEGDIATVGISDHAQEELGDVALVQFPEVGRVLQRDQKFGEIESIKAVSDLFAPVGGEVVAVNESIEDAPEIVNNDPYGAGWLLKLRVKDTQQADSLLDKSTYDDYVKGL